jgi:predicted transcriptional regulator
MRSNLKKVLMPSLLERIEALEAEASDYIEEQLEVIARDCPGVPRDSIRQFELLKGQYILAAVKRLLQKEQKHA